MTPIHRILATGLVAATMAIPAGQTAAGLTIDYYPDPRLPVVGVTTTTFEVIEARGAGPRDIWCAAARYAVFSLGMDRGRIYIATPRAPSPRVRGAKGVVFSIRDTGDAANTGVSITTRVKGANLPVNHALQFCRDYLIDLDDL